MYIAINWQATHYTRRITLLVCYFAMKRVLLRWPTYKDTKKLQLIHLKRNILTGFQG